MIDVTFQPLHGQTEVAIAGLIFEAGETKTFGDGSNDLTDADAEFILTNPNFIDASLGRNPNFTCQCERPITAFVDDANGRHRSDAMTCDTCAQSGDAAPGPMPKELAAALADSGKPVSVTTARPATPSTSTT